MIFFSVLNFFSVLIILSLQACGQENSFDENTSKEPEETYALKTGDLLIRDPFIYVDSNENNYYLHASAGNKIVVYKSKDLLNWKFLGNSFVPKIDFWGKQDFWAPDLYEYKGRYYLFVTFSSPIKKRGTSILVSENPEGPYQPLVNRAVTPDNWMCLDGALFIDDKDEPWIIYCHEWLEVGNGKIIAQKLSEDIIQTEGNPIVLFSASDAPWVGSISFSGVTGKVTDAPFVYKLTNGELIMLWSSFGVDGKYAIALARSANGSILGPWEQNVEPLNNDDGGHAMLFKDFKGRLMISYHSPNSNTERPNIKQVYINNGELVVPQN